MELGLYFNAYLTQDAAWNPDNRDLPLYPRAVGVLDSQDKISVCKLSISSMTLLPIKRIILNIGTASCFGNKGAELIQLARECFPHAEVISRESRPSTIQEWIEDTERARNFFGEDMPIICAFNHDHVFTDRRATPFVDLVAKLFSGSGSNKKKYLYYSHAPESISTINSPSAMLKWYRDCLKIDAGFNSVSRVDARCYKVPSVSVIHGIFVSTVSGLEWIWKSATADDPDSYVARPDWPTLTFNGVEFDCYHSNREFFRHFDGYGHLSMIGRGLAIGFQESMSSDNYHFNNNTGGNQVNAIDDIIPLMENDVQYYVSTFFDLYSLSAKCKLYDAITNNIFWSGRDQLNLLYKSFTEAYLDCPGELDSYSDNEKIIMRKMIEHGISARSLDWQMELLGDSFLYGLKFNRSTSSFPYKDSHTSRFVNRVKRKLMRIMNF